MAKRKDWKDMNRKEKATGLIALGIFILIVIVAASAIFGGSKKANTTLPLGSYTNATQIMQVLKAHHVPCNNVTKDTGLTSFTGATSGVWIETAPGDSAAQFGGSANAGTDTEIVVFKNHADAISYVNIGNTADHQLILGTNWAIAAASPAATRIRTVLGGALAGSTAAPSTPTPKATPKVATRQVTGTATTIGAGTFTGGKDVGVGLYDVTAGAGQSGNFSVTGTDSYNEILGQSDPSLSQVPMIRVQISSGDQISISGLSSVSFTPVTAPFVTAQTITNLYAGTFTVGQDIAAGRYVVTPGSGQSGNFSTSGGSSYNEILGRDSSLDEVPSLTVTLNKGDVIATSGMSQVTFTPSN